MSTAVYKKLETKLDDPTLAALLVRAGYTNPRQIRDASDQGLLDIHGIGQASLDKIRAVFPQG